MSESVKHDSLTFKNNPDNFQAGRIKLCYKNWQRLTPDAWILNVVKGYSLELTDTPTQDKLPRPIKFEKEEEQALQNSLQEFLALGIIEQSRARTETCFFSNLFLRPKADGTFRVIFNLSGLNDFVVKHHFKMDTIKDAINLMKPGCFLASLDFKHAYFSVSVNKRDRKHLSFHWKGQVYQFTCLPQGLSSAPRVFTKLLKPVLATLRKKGIVIISYIDDSLLFADTREDLEAAIHITGTLFDELGLTIHPGKSVLRPVQEIDYLGFHLDAIKMTISLTPEKKEKIAGLALKLLKSKSTIQELASFIGNVVAADPAVLNAPLHYKSLEILRNELLRTHKGDYDACVTLSPESRADIIWWIDNIQNAESQICVPSPHFEIHSDASNTGWGGVFNSQATGGQWLEEEASHHINWLELKAGLLTLQTFCSNFRDQHIKMRMDNTTAVACINKRGTMKPEILQLTKNIFSWAQDRNIHLSASHIAGVANTEADAESRVKNVDTEWMLDPGIFSEICEVFGKPEVDLFASRLNAQLPSYVAWRPDPNAKDVDAFTISWRNVYNYAFPPFSVMGRLLRKAQLEEAEMLVIAPVWATRPWFPRMLQMLVRPPRLLPLECIRLPQSQQQTHPMGKKLRLAVFRLSGRPIKCKAFRKTLPNSYSDHGEQVRINSMADTLDNGFRFVIHGKWIQFTRL